MIYSGIEHLIDRKLAEKNTFFLDMKKKPTQKQTAQWFFSVSKALLWCSLIINSNRRKIHASVF